MNEEASPEKPLRFVLSSSYRIETLVALSKGYKTPSQIAEETGTYSSHVSRALKELSDRGLVACDSSSEGKSKNYSLTDTGARISGRLKILTGRPSLEYKLMKTLDQLSIPYGRNIALSPDGQRGVAEIVVLDDELNPRMAIAVRDLSEDLIEGIKDAVFWVSTWKEETEGLKRAVLLGGKSKEEILETKWKEFLEQEFVDFVIHEKDLDCIRGRELDFEEFLEVEEHCVDWPTE